jgi:hypothetical protein
MITSNSNIYKITTCISEQHNKYLKFIHNIHFWCMLGNTKNTVFSLQIRAVVNGSLSSIAEYTKGDERNGA